MTGQRWRCLVCENYISYDDLQLCGFTEGLIHEFRKDLVPTERDRVEFCSNGSYKLLGARKQRYTGRKRPAPDNVESGSSLDRKATSSSKSSEPLIILLDD